jgi:hypothetical protein
MKALQNTFRNHSLQQQKSLQKVDANFANNYGIQSLQKIFECENFWKLFAQNLKCPLKKSSRPLNTV